MNMPITLIEEPSELDVEQQMLESAGTRRRVSTGCSSDAAYRRGVHDGGAAVFNAVMSHESNKGRGMGLYLQLKDVAAEALAGKVIVADPDEQPLWEHLLQEAFEDFDARLCGDGPYAKPAHGERDAFKAAVRTMLLKKLPAPDSENLRLRQLLCDVLKALGNGAGAEPTASLQFLSSVPQEVRLVVAGLRGTSEKAHALSAEDREILEAVRRELEDDDGNAPGHAHEVPGVWDSDNRPERAGQPCAWCLTWSKFTRLIEQGAGPGVAETPAPAHSKSEYKRRVALGDTTVVPPVGAVRVCSVNDAACAEVPVARRCAGCPGVNPSRGGEQG